MEKTIKYRTCNICEALCGLAIAVENNQITSIKGDKEDTFSKGHLCPKAYALKDVHEDPDRLKHPIRKVNGEWQPISWEEAFAYTAKQLAGIQQQNGDDALGIYQGNPSIHNLGTMLYGPPFVRSLKTKNRFSATSVDQLPHHLAADAMFGHPNLIPIPDIPRTDFWLIFGGNPLVSNGSLMTAPDVGGKLRAIQERGGKVVVIDPRRTRTAKKADQHLFIRPATDIWLLLAILNRIITTKSYQLDRIRDIIDQVQLTQIEAAVERFTPALASTITGIPETEITTLADEYIQASSAVCYGRLGVSVTEYGSLCHWAINLINILSGNFDREGGAMFTSSAVSVTNAKPGKQRFGRWHSRVSQFPEFAGELPMSAFIEEMLTPGEGQIKAMITSCGNPVLSAPNGRQIDQALEQLDFMVSIDIYLNETTRHADIILPPATGVETAHLGIFFHNLAVHNSVKYSKPTVEKEAGAKYDWEIFSALKLAYEAEVARLNETDVPQQPVFDLDTTLTYFLQSSPYSFEELKKQVHGIDMGPLKSNIAIDKVRTTDSKINLFPAIYHETLAQLSPPEIDSEQLSLIGRRDLRSMNSWLHNSLRMVKGKEICTAQIHPEDAKLRFIEQGQLITVSTDKGQIQIRAEISDEVGKGIISIPHGWGHDRKGIKLKVAAQHHGASYNDLADEKRMDKIVGTAAVNGIPVYVK